MQVVDQWNINSGQVYCMAATEQRASHSRLLERFLPPQSCLCAQHPCSLLLPASHQDRAVRLVRHQPRFVSPSVV